MSDERERVEVEKLDDCRIHGRGAGSELLVVEGDSAADSVDALRHDQWQAVLPMQGKPMNTLKASRNKVAKSPPLGRLVQSIGAGWDEHCDADESRYDRIIILCDPDIDGVHTRSLLLLFFYRWMRPVLDAGMIYTARPPLWRITSEQLDEPMYAWSDAQFKEVEADLDNQGIHGRSTSRFRGLGNMIPDVLFDSCLNPETRTLARLNADHAEAAIRSFEMMKAQLRPRAVRPQDT